MNEKLRVLDIFSGIGGFSLGLERTGGFETVAFCEIDPYCRAVLRKHWPHVKQYEDVRTLPLARGMADVVTAGFPCQDISFAGEGAGLAGERSGLWWKVRRAIRVVRPRLALLENGAALLGRGMGTVLGSLAAIGYDAEWHCIPLARLGAPHERDRCWIIATNTYETRCKDSQRRHGHAKQNWRSMLTPGHAQRRSQHWQVEPPLVRVVHGISGQMDGIDPPAVAALGNSASPIQIEIIGEAILEAEGMIA